MKSFKTFALLFMGVFVLTGAAARPSRPLVIAVSTEPSTLDGQAVIDRNSRVANGNIFESLLDRNRGGEIVPSLAVSYQSINDRTWRFRLRKGVKFHNGELFTAESAAFSINRILDKKYKTQRSSYIQGISGAKVVDEYTVDVTTNGVNAVLPVQMTQLVMVPKAAAEKTFGERPVGTGPYKFMAWERGRDITLVVNPDYWGKQPPIKQFVVRVIPDAQTQISALQAGEVDLVLDLLPEQAQLAPKFLSAPASEFSYIAFNTYKKELSDPRVRIAMNLAVDKVTLAKSLYLGHAVPNHAQHLAKGMLGYNPELRPFPYDPQKARQLLRDAGYPNGFEVVLHAPIGRYLKGEETSEFVAAQLKAIGLKASVQLHEWNAYRKLGRIPGPESGAFDLKYGWNSNEWFDGSRIVSHITCKGTSSKICNKKVDELMNKAIKTLNQKERHKLYQQVWSALREDPYSIYLLQQNLIYGMTARLEWQPRLDDEVRVETMRLRN
jgi:peptide/nickel transport system substrate-binding protein